MDLDQKEEETVSKDNEDLRTTENKGKYRIILQCSFFSDNEAQ